MTITATIPASAMRAAWVAVGRDRAPLARDVVAAAVDLGCTLTARQGAAALRAFDALRLLRCERKSPAVVPGGWLRTLALMLRNQIAPSYADAAPSYAGGTTVAVSIGAPAAFLTTMRTWADFGRDRHEQTSATVGLHITGRMLRALRHHQVPAVLSGVAHLDCQRKRGGWKVLCQTITKGARGAQPAPVWQFLASEGVVMAHGATLAEAQATVASRLADTAAYHARSLAASRRTDRVGYLVDRILLRGRAPACWQRLMIAREDCVKAGACRIGTDAWLGRNGLDAQAAALPLRVIARAAAKRTGDQLALAARIITAAIRRQVPAAAI